MLSWTLIINIHFASTGIQNHLSLNRISNLPNTYDYINAILYFAAPVIFMQLTSEQLNILSTNENLVINAVAGSGKTTTLIEYAKTRNAGSKILYLAFNRSVKLEAEQKFAAAGVTNVKVETAHSLAFDHIVKCSGYNVIQGYKSYDWVEILGIQRGDRHIDYMIGNHVNRFISYFCNGTELKSEFA